MRRLPSVLLLAALALGTLAFAPAPAAPTAPAAPAAPVASQATDASQIVVCVRFREWTVPVIGYTWEPEYERFCVKAPDVNPDILPVGEDRL